MHMPITVLDKIFKTSYAEVAVIGSKQLHNNVQVNHSHMTGRTFDRTNRKSQLAPYVVNATTLPHPECLLMLLTSCIPPCLTSDLYI